MIDADRSLLRPGISHSRERLVTRGALNETDLTSLAPRTPPSAVDLVHLVFIIDDHADIEAAPVVREMVDAMQDVLDNPYKPIPAGEITLCQACQEFVVQFMERFSTRTHHKPSTISGYGD